VEDVLQTKFQHLRLGNRLWRCVAKGRSTDEQDVAQQNVYTVFATYSESVLQEIKGGRIKVVR
jgi:hypothetical protein